MRAAVINVGDELILGEQENSNQQWMLHTLKQYGVFCESALVLRDHVDSIANAVQGLLMHEIPLIFVSGGLGGTHDDVTRLGIARGIGCELELHTECDLILQSRYEGRYNHQRQRMAWLPPGAELIPNALGAPGFIVKSIVGLPGFPRMLPSMMEYVLKDRLGLSSEASHQLVVREYTLNCTEGDVALAVEELLQTTEGRLQVGIYPDPKPAARSVVLRFRMAARDSGLDSRVEEFLQALSACLEPDS